MVPGEGNRRLGLVGESSRPELGGEEGADMLTLKVDDVSEGTRSASVSNGLSSSKLSMVKVKAKWIVQSVPCCRGNFEV